MGRRGTSSPDVLMMKYTTGSLGARDLAGVDWRIDRISVHPPGQRHLIGLRAAPGLPPGPALAAAPASPAACPVACPCRCPYALAARRRAEPSVRRCSASTNPFGPSAPASASLTRIGPPALTQRPALLDPAAPPSRQTLAAFLSVSPSLSPIFHSTLLRTQLLLNPCCMTRAFCESRGYRNDNT